MARIFISHSSLDAAEASAVKQWLNSQGWHDVFFYDDPEAGLVAAERWRHALAASITRCRAVIFCLSSNWCRSPHCVSEYDQAINAGATPVGVIIKPLAESDNVPGSLAEWQTVDLTRPGQPHIFTVKPAATGVEQRVSFPAEELLRLRGGLAKLGLVGLDTESFPWPPPTEPDRAPYRGLAPLDRQDAGIFFGRDSDLVAAREKLLALRAQGGRQLFVVLGASGSGKSSFLRAGLVERLKREDADFLVLPVVRPRDTPISGDSGLARALADAFEGMRSPRPLGDIKRLLDSGQSALHLFSELQDLAASQIIVENVAQVDRRPTIVLPIDQAEELYSASAGEEAQRFVELIAPLLRFGPETIAILTIRTDRLEPLQAIETLRDIAIEPFNLRPVSATAFREAILGPARRVRPPIEVDPVLVERLLSETAAQGADPLPLLALTLQRLHLNYGHATGTLSLSHYEQLQGLKGSISDAVSAAFRNPLSPPAIPPTDSERVRLLEEVFVPALVDVNEQNGEPLRRIAPLRSLPEAGQNLVRRLVESRLLVQDSRGEPTVEVAHEALLRQWDVLSTLIARRSDDIREIQSVERAAWAWQQNDRRSDWLVHKGERLDSALKLASRPEFARRLERNSAEDDSRSAEQAAVGRQYLDRCRAAQDAARRERDKDAAARVRLQRRLRYGSVAAIVSLVGTLGAFALPTGWHIDANENVLEQLKRPQSWSFDRTGSRVAAIVQDEGDKPFARVWQISPRVDQVPLISVPASTSATLAPDGTHLAVVEDGRLYLYSTAGPSAPPPAAADYRLPPEEGRDERRSVPQIFSFSSDGKWLVTVPSNGEVKVIETAAPENNRTLMTVDADALVKGKLQISAATTRAEFLMCTAESVWLVRPDRIPRTVPMPLVSQRFVGCDYASGDKLVVVQSSDSVLSILDIEQDRLRLRREVTFPQHAKPSDVGAKKKGPERHSDPPAEAQEPEDQGEPAAGDEGPEQIPISYVVNHAGSLIFGRARNGPLARADLRGQGPIEAEPIVKLDQARQGRTEPSSSLWAAANDKWIAGSGEEGALYVWNAESTGPLESPPLVRRSRAYGELPFFAALRTKDVALVSNGRGVLRSVELGQPIDPDTSVNKNPVTRTRLGGQSLRLAPLADDAGWQATSTAEVVLIDDKFSTVRSPTILSEIDTTIRSADGSALWATTETGLVRFRRTIKLWGLPIWRLEWPRILFGLETSGGPTSSDGGRLPGRGGGDGGGDGGGGGG